MARPPSISLLAPCNGRLFSGCILVLSLLDLHCVVGRHHLYYTTNIAAILALLPPYLLPWTIRLGVESPCPSLQETDVCQG
ncbi:hypothetical protein BKA70DRAFT_676066 [Coprinopsis sp. MPI-PUGE-AT-0042]|nr:hypothetical protein BKA70DRAFT_676066 [Coprinopsis sp. MPI-PUGE-AT-0042]